MRLGTGAAERFVAALIVSAVFFLVCLAIASSEGFDPSRGLLMATVAFLCVLAPSAFAVAGATDAQLRDRFALVERELAEMPVTVPEPPAPAEEEVAGQPPAEYSSQHRRAPSVTADAMLAGQTARRESHKPCPYCGESILAEARKCKVCGEFLDEALRARQGVHVHVSNPVRVPRWSPGVAVVLSFFWPGLGQMYKGQILNGLAWMALVPVGYVCCVLPGLVLHLCCLLGASMGDPSGQSGAPASPASPPRLLGRALLSIAVLLGAIYLAVHMNSVVQHLDDWIKSSPAQPASPVGNQPGQSAPALHPEDLPRISATDLVEAFLDNPIRAESLYKGKQYRVEGTVTKITRASSVLGMGGEALLKLDTNILGQGVNAFMNKETGDSEVVHLNVGDRVVLTGKVDDLSFGRTVAVSQCHLVSSTAPKEP
jgi:hypothetical protein